MVFVLKYLDSSFIVYWFGVGNQDEIFLWSLIKYFYYFADVSVNQICEVTKFWALFSKKYAT